MRAIVILLALTVSFLGKRDPPRTFQVFIVSDGIIYEGDRKIAPMDKLSASDVIHVPTKGYCILLDSHGNLFSLTAGTKTKLDTLVGRSLKASLPFSLSALYSSIPFTPIVLDRDVCRPLINFPMPFAGKVKFKEEDVLFFISSPANVSLSLTIKSVYDEHLADIELKPGERLHLESFSKQLLKQGEFLLTAKAECHYKRSQIFELCDRNAIFNDINLTELPPVLVLKAAYFEYYHAYDEAGKLYQLALDKALPDHEPVYQEFLDTFNKRTHR